MRALVSDVRHAFRTFGPARAFTSAAVLSLLWNRSPALGITEDWFSMAQYFDIKTDAQSFEHVAIAIGGNDNLYNLTAGGGEPERIGTIRASAKSLPMLGGRPVLGRRSSADEDILGHRVCAAQPGMWVRLATPGHKAPAPSLDDGARLPTRELGSLTGEARAELRILKRHRSSTPRFERGFLDGLVPGTGGAKGVEMLNVFWIVVTMAAQGAANSVADLSWLSGCWQYTAGPRTVTEFWLPPDGGTMLGLSRTVSGGKTVEHEFVLLRVGPRGVEYVAKPSGQAETVFTSTKVASDEVIFENPAHDFPTRITYRKTEGGLVATIDGVVNGTPRAIDFRYSAATTCTQGGRR